MQPHEERVVIEQQELEDKLVKLQAFVNGDKIEKLPQTDRDLLIDQYHTMVTYNNLLLRRIERFKEVA